MYMLCSVLAICLTVIYLARYAGAQKWQPQLVIALQVAGAHSQQPIVAPDEELETMRSTAPKDILEFCSQESEPFAVEDQLRKAYRLYAKHQDWSTVGMELVNSSGREID